MLVGILHEARIFVIGLSLGPCPFFFFLLFLFLILRSCISGAEAISISPVHHLTDDQAGM